MTHHSSAVYTSSVSLPLHARRQDTRPALYAPSNHADITDRLYGRRDMLLVPLTICSNVVHEHRAGRPYKGERGPGGNGFGQRRVSPLCCARAAGAITDTLNWSNYSLH